MTEEIVYLEVDGEELLPCPFCGGLAVIFLAGDGYAAPQNPSDDDGKVYTVECAVCGMGSLEYFHSPKEALQVWNKRGQ